MSWKQYMALAIAAGAALFFSAAAPVSATSPGLTAATMSGIAAPQSPAGYVIEARGRHGHHGYRRHGGWYGRHGYHRHRHHNGIGWALPLLAVPLIVESQRHDYGYDDDDGDDYRDSEYEAGLACYKRCREYNGPDFCRANHRKYC